MATATRAAISKSPVQFYTNANGETCFRETVAGEYKIGRAGNVVRYR